MSLSESKFDVRLDGHAQSGLYTSHGAWMRDVLTVRIKNNLIKR